MHNYGTKSHIELKKGNDHFLFERGEGYFCAGKSKGVIYWVYKIVNDDWVFYGNFVFPERVSYKEMFETVLSAGDINELLEL